MDPGTAKRIEQSGAIDSGHDPLFDGSGDTVTMNVLLEPEVAELLGNPGQIDSDED